MRRLRLLLAALTMLMVLGVARAATWYPQGPLPKPLDLSAPMLGDGFTFVPLAQLLESYPSDTYVLYYFSATCGHCIQAGPTIAKLAKTMKEKGIPTIGIATGRNSVPQIEGYKVQFGIDFPIYRDTSAAFGRDNNVRSTPTVFILKKSGEAHAFVGLGPGTDTLIAASAIKLAGGDALSVLDPNAYNGPRVCATCHVEEYRSWSLTHHSVALYSLKDEAQRADPECVGCHVTGWQKPTGYTALTETPELIHVTCEQCHGMAGGHGKPRPPRAADVSTAWQATCTACHDKKHSIGFTVDKGLPIVSHGLNRTIPEAEFHAQRRKLENGEVERPLISFPEGKIQGSESCKACHAEQHSQWTSSAHGQAINSLQAKGQADNPECLACHAVLKDGAQKADASSWAPGVGCESCHGPGEAHVKAGGGTENIVGLTESCPVCVIEAMCTNCHTLEHDKDFDLTRDLPLAGHAGAAAKPAKGKEK